MCGRIKHKFTRYLELWTLLSYIMTEIFASDARIQTAAQLAISSLKKHDTAQSVN